ncbi:uncharacterized protein LOC130216282 [Danio aesculapii]|uniref:uncharacterized protein LOC130216282 n=1 Tax=Danio aesculapii TaxID=1142201 RepID=UPI0024BFA488|nr:uncharacterized protein LOC130216282 [Danio aesculapii]
MTNHSLLLWLFLFLHGASGAVEVSVSVMKGDSVTLHTGVSELQTDNKVDWTHGDGTIIAKIENNQIKKKDPAGLFEGRLEIDSKTGSLTVKNIRTEDKGFYKLDIGGKKDLITKNFSVTVREGAKKVLVMERESIALHTGVIEIKGFDQIFWTFEGHLMAEINQETNQFFLHNISVVRFDGRLDLHRQTGDLIIRIVKTTDAGDYHLKMSNSSYTLQRTISVAVSEMDPPTLHLHPGYIALICVSVLMFGAAVFYVIRHKICKQKKQRGLASSQSTQNTGQGVL